MKDGDSDRSGKVQNPDIPDDGKQLQQASEDPGSFLILCTINNEYFSSALADLGSSINVMPTVIYERLDLCRPFLHIADATIHVLQREISLSDGRNRIRVSDLEEEVELTKEECLRMEISYDDQNPREQVGLNDDALDESIRIK
uniref:uncharacterized protein LOC122587170 n=1 Tax=Erigeron canadensis TaxID=72917 RepID=UPI001CB9906F|nr:uncharacterized protein LOC122587170 [Erigeron canadensis]